MITAVDTIVLPDVSTADPDFGDQSAEMLRDCMVDGKMIACEVVRAEISATFPDNSEAEQALARIGIEFVPMDQKICSSSRAILEEIS